jgi:cysteinyl-tRNA synthetase
LSLGLNEPLKNDTEVYSPEVLELIAKRKTLRAEKKWAEADQIRDQLVSMGVEVKDK